MKDISRLPAVSEDLMTQCRNSWCEKYGEETIYEVIAANESNVIAHGKTNEKIGYNDWWFLWGTGTVYGKTELFRPEIECEIVKIEGEKYYILLDGQCMAIPVAASMVDLYD